MYFRYNKHVSLSTKSFASSTSLFNTTILYATIVLRLYAPMAGEMDRERELKRDRLRRKERDRERESACVS